VPLYSPFLPENLQTLEHSETYCLVPNPHQVVEEADVRGVKLAVDDLAIDKCIDTVLVDKIAIFVVQVIF